MEPIDEQVPTSSPVAHPSTTTLRGHGLSRRDFMKLAGGAGVAAVAAGIAWPEGYAFAAGVGGVSQLGPGGTDYVPEQIHLTWGADPSSAVTVSWATPSAPTAASTPQVTVTPAGGGASVVVPAVQKTYTDGLSGESVYAYHAALTGLSPSTGYDYTIADAADTAVTFSSSFTTAGTGRFAFAFTSFGDLATPGAGATYTLADGSTIESTTYSESQWNAYNAVGEVESLQPLFHVLNGDLAYADKVTITSSGGLTTATGAQPSPEVWRDFFLNLQRSAANRVWMPTIGNHEVELDNGPYGYASWNTRFLLPGNGTAFSGSFYSYQVGSVLFISLDANDVCYQGSGAYNVGDKAVTALGTGDSIPATAAQYNQFYTGTFTPNTTTNDGTWVPGSVGGSPANVQTTWLEGVLAAARSNDAIDWIVVSMHQSALSSSTDNGCDAAIRQAWYPLFDQYQVDLVVNGHDHDYERSWPVRGFTPDLGTGIWGGGTVVSTSTTPSNSPATQTTTYVPANTGTVNTFTPNVVTTDETSPFDTTQGTVYMVLGGGGTDKRDNTYGSSGGKPQANVTTFTQVRTGSTKPGPDSTEPAAWSAMRDTTDAYGVAYFAVDPGQPGGNTTITVTYYHAPTQTSGAPNYSSYDTFQLTRPRSDTTPPVVPEFPMPAVVVGGTLALAGGAVLLAQRRHAAAELRAAAAQSGAELTGASSDYN